MTTANGSAVQPAPAQETSPIARWVARHLQNGGDMDDITASARLFEEVLFATAIAETVSPGAFGFDARLNIREIMGEVKVALEAVEIAKIDAHVRTLDASRESPFLRMLLENNQKRRLATESTDPKAGHIQRILALDAAAACEVFATLRCVEAITETIAPKMFKPEEKLALRESLAEARGTLATMSTSDLDDHMKVIDAKPDSPVGKLLVGIYEQRKIAGSVPTQHLLALDAAVTRDVFADIKCAQAVGRSLPGVETFTPTQAIALYDALCEHKERLASFQEQSEAAAI